MNATFEQRLASQYSGLSAKLREAGDYVVKNPVEVATRSLRAVAADSKLAPATFSRLARALGYDDFEALRETMREKIDRSVNNFASRADRLQAEHSGQDSGFVNAHFKACLNNIEKLSRGIDQNALGRVADRLHSSRSVLLHGGLGSTGVVEYLAYMASFCADNWSLTGRSGASFSSSLVGKDERDSLVIVTMPPFSSLSIKVAEAAHAQGVHVTVITDTHTCPALRHASESFIVPTDSPHFYSSYVATMVLAEALVGMLVTRAGPTARDRIARIESSNQRLEEVWAS